MMMGTGSMETMMISSTATAGSSTATSMDMDMSSSSSMMTHFTSDYNGVPVLFKTLSAATGAKAFGIFVFLFFLSFSFRGLSFVSAYVEQKIFRHDAAVLHLVDKVETGRSSDFESDDDPHLKGHQENITNVGLIGSKEEAKAQTAIGRFFDFSLTSIYRDFIRFLLAFISVMVGYALMLAVMSYVILYFFAVILGLSFAEIFFRRLAYALQIKPSHSICESLH